MDLLQAVGVCQSISLWAEDPWHAVNERGGRRFKWAVAIASACTDTFPSDEQRNKDCRENDVTFTKQGEAVRNFLNLFSA